MTEAEERRLYMQRYHLPDQLKAARAKVRALEKKAVRLGMPELVRKDRQP